MMTAVETAAQEPLFSHPGIKRIFTLLFLINLFNYIDRQILFAVFPLIKADMALSDAQLGLLGSVFMIVYMVYSPIAGYFGDRMRRPVWIGASTIVWSFATMWSGRVGSYAELVCARSSIGVGEGGFMTMAPAYLMEKFHVSRRSVAMSLFTMALPVGSAIGYLLGGFLGGHFGWRNAFMIVGVPGIILGLLAFTLEDKAHVKKVTAHKPALRDYATLLKNKPYLYASLSMAAATFSLGGLAAWMPSYFNRYLQLDVAKAGMLFGGITVVAGAAGTLLGGWLANKLQKRDKGANFTVTAWAFFVSIPFGVGACLATGLPLTVALFFSAIMLVFAYSGPLNAAIVDSTPEGIRSMAFAANIFIIHALGDAISPAIIGVLSDHYGLKIAVIACVLVLAMAGVFAWLGGKEEVKLFETSGSRPD